MSGSVFWCEYCKENVYSGHICPNVNGKVGKDTEKEKDIEDIFRWFDKHLVTCYSTVDYANDFYQLNINQYKAFKKTWRQ